MWLLHWNRRTVVKLFILKTGRNKECQNSRNLVWMGIVPRLKWFTNSSVVLSRAYMSAVPRFQNEEWRCSSRTIGSYDVEQITRAGYQVKVQWECEFDDAGMVN